MNLRTHYFKNSKFTNFGDELVPYILKYLHPDAEVERVSRDYSGKILCIGSELASDIAKPGDVIWGYGAKYKKEIILPEGVQLLATRGPMTRKLICGCSDQGIYGDPAILMPLIYTPEDQKEKFAVGVIPHYVDLPKFKNLKDPDILVIDVKEDPFKIINQILSCDLIISTSLHGLIVSESYGKPAVWLQVSDKIQGAAFKFNDYFAGSGRDMQDPIKLVNIGPSNIAKACRNKFLLPKPVHDTQSLLFAWRQNQ